MGERKPKVSSLSSRGSARRAGGARGIGRAPGILVALLCLVLVGPAAADEETDWQTVREVDGITLARRDDGDAPAFRAVTVLEADLPRVLAVLRDVPRHVEWRSRLVEARVLERETDRIATLYNRMEGSWPVSDRDVVLRTEAVIEGPDAVRIELRAVESSLGPDPDGAVRMPRLEGRYALRALDPQRTRVEFEIRADLGGAVPGWVVRFVAEDMPLETLMGLRRQVDRSSDAYDAFARAWPAAVSRGEIPSLR